MEEKVWWSTMAPFMAAKKQTHTHTHTHTHTQRKRERERERERVSFFWRGLS
jgi:hypothetical protein